MTAINMSLWDKAVDSLKDKDKDNVDFQRTDKHAILVDILEEVRKKKRLCIERRLKYKRRNGESVLLYDVYEKMVKWVTKFKEVGDIAIQYDPGHAALPWAAIRFFLHISVNDVQIFGKLAEGLEVVCKIVARYAAIERFYLHQPTSVKDLLENSIIALYASILVFFSKCRKYFDLGLAQRIARSIAHVPEHLDNHLENIAVNDANVRELTSIIDAERAQLSDSQQSLMSDNVDSLGREIETLQRESASKLEALLASFQGLVVRTVDPISTRTEGLAPSKNESQKKEERLQILLWLSNVQYKKHHETLSKGLLEGTGSWLLGKPQFLEWRNSSVSSVLWLHGIPGSGKTCLMSTVIQQSLAENSICENAAPIAYFYCQRNTAEPQRSDPTEVLRSILRQLLCYVPLWQETSFTAKDYKVRKLEADEDGFEVPRLDIMETIDRLIEIASRMPVTILIDALDECQSGQRHELLGALDVLLDKSAHLVKVFVSSRDDVDIVLRLQKHPNIYISIDDNEDDIHRFIQSEIQKATSDRRLLNGTASPDLTSLITDVMAMKAGGMFLWVSLQLENLCDNRRIKIEGDLVDELARLPRNLADMYARILENIGRIERRGRTVAETVLKWLVCTQDARSSVTIAAVSEKGSTEHRCLSVSDILDVCSTLIIYDEVSDRFRFAHLSIREFLESQPGYTPSEANRAVLQLSLQTLTTNQSLDDPFWSYARCYWIFHNQKLEGQHRKEVFEFHTKRFLFDGAETSESFNVWATAYRWFYGWRKSEMIPSEMDSSGIMVTHDVDYVLQSPIGLASCHGWLEILDHFEASHSPDEHQAVAVGMMKLAVIYQRPSVVRWLVNRNLYPTHEHLDLTFRYRRLEIIKTLLEMDVISFDTLVNGQEVIVFVVRLGLWHLYCDLTRKGANRTFRDRNGRTLLSHAVSSSTDCSKIIEDLLLAGMCPTAPDNDGRTPLWLSIWGERHPHSISSLLTAKLSDLLAISSFGKSLLQVLRSSYYYTTCLLLHYGLDSMLEDKDMRAEWTKSLDLVAKLVRIQVDWASVIKGADNLPDDAEVQMHLAGQTLLGLAALFCHRDAFRALLDLGVDPTGPAICEIRCKRSTVVQKCRLMSGQDASDQEGVSICKKMSDELRQGPLAWASYTGNLPLVQSILERGLDPNIKNRKGQTALYFAVQQTRDNDPLLEVEKEAIVRLLLQRGALVNSADAYSGATVLAKAFEARYSTVARILLENGAVMPKGPTNGPLEPLLGAFRSGGEGIRQTLLERSQSDGVDLPGVQWPLLDRRWSGDTQNIAARLMWGGTMRVLGDVLNKVDRSDE